MAAIEVGLHPATYSRDSPTRHELLAHDLIVCPPYHSAFRELAVSGVSSCVVSILAMSSALGMAIDSLYPPGLSDLPNPLSTTIRGRTDCADRSISLMWTTMDDVTATGNVNIDQFVPLFPRQQSTRSTANEVNHLDDIADGPPTSHEELHEDENHLLLLLLLVCRLSVSSVR